MSRVPALGGITSLSVRIQSVLYQTPFASLTRAIEFFDNAARVARHAGVARDFVLAYGDCSPGRTITPEVLRSLRYCFSNLTSIEYTFFNQNLGSAQGHNRLLEEATSDLTVIANPDVLAAPNMLIELIDALGRPRVGLVEARQLPIEHPKYYDPKTGETSWASTACSIASTQLFRKLDGFDADTFFLYCDDVDFSWRVRLTGVKVIHQPTATVFHDKRLTADGGWRSSDAERYYSAEASLLLPFKYSRPDLTLKYIEHFLESGEEHLVRAAHAFELRSKTGRLPIPIDPEHAVAEFVDGGYARPRFMPC
jgi:GT2 family glycosyltransferase